MSGEIVVDGYSKLTHVGRGGTSTVFSAVRTSDSMPVAIKVFDPSEDRSFTRQLNAATPLTGIEGVVELLDSGRLDDGRAYMIFPFAAGGSLADHMHQFGKMGTDRMTRLGSQLARALQHAHEAGIVHRDLKPSNLLIGVDGEPLLSDFGASLAIDVATASETMSLTLLYAAPEVLQGASATPKSDVYSLGLSLLALHNGANPFGGRDQGLATLVNEICEDGVPSSLGDGLPEGVRAVLWHAVALDPDDRPDAAEFAAELESVTDQPDVRPEHIPLQRGSSPLPERDQRNRRNSTIAAVAAAIALIAVVSGWALTRDNPTDLSVGSGSSESTTTTTFSQYGDPITEANGMMGPLYQQDDISYIGLLDRNCSPDERLMEVSIHANPEDTANDVEFPWEAVASDKAGVFMSYAPCDTGIREARFILGASGLWFVFIAEFPQDEYDRMSKQMTINETSPSPDWGVYDVGIEALTNPDAYKGWAKIVRDA